MIYIPKLFNEDGSDDFDSQLIVGGNPTGISNLNNVRYKWANPLYRTMVGNFWLPTKVNLTEDKVTIKQLDDAENEALKDTLSFLIFLDSFQTNNLPNIANYITCPAVKNTIAVQVFQEVIHSESYQYSLEALYPSMERDAIYNRWRTNQALKERNKFVAKIAQDFVDNPNDESFDKVLVANVCLEGIYFYQGFNYFDQLAHRKKIVQTAKIIDYIRRDEYTHMGLFINILRERRVSHGLIQDMIGQATENEISWSHDTYGDRILGISKTGSKQYLHWLANDRCERLGVSKIYQDVKNPYQHLEAASKEGAKRENFFESGGVTSYDMADSVDGWDVL